MSKSRLVYEVEIMIEDNDYDKQTKALEQLSKALKTIGKNDYVTSWNIELTKHERLTGLEAQTH